MMPFATHRFFRTARLAAILAASVSVPAIAQTAWVQIEAQPDIRSATERAQAYAATFDDVHAFQITTGWVAIALGPQDRAEADARAARLRASGLVPRDSYVTDGREYLVQVWPTGADARRPAAERGEPREGVGETAPAASDRTVAETLPDEALPDETLAEARALERAYTPEERRAIQTALAWTGDYTMAIDGVFGPGSRNAIASWQARFGAEPTGFLTTRQRVALLSAYEAEMARFGFATIRNVEAGIEVQIPTSMVEFARIEPPFVHYESVSAEAIRVLLISQEGNRSTLHGLYDVMQTLEIVPLSGERERRDNSFLLTGQNAEIGSHTEARLQGGAVKGFTVVWPRRSDADAAEVISAMSSSFRALDGVLDETIGFAERAASVDLLAGLTIRRPERAGSGFFVNSAGTVVTAAPLVEGCGRVTLDERHEAEVKLADPQLGLAVLRPQVPLAPLAYATFGAAMPRLNEDVALAGFSYGGLLGAPTMTLGRLADVGGLGGEAHLARLSMTVLPGDAGGPVLDARGTVIGMLAPRPEGPQILPGDVQFALASQSLLDRLGEAGIAARNGDGDGGRLAIEDITRLASGMTVLVSCWN